MFLKYSDDMCDQIAAKLIILNSLFLTSGRSKVGDMIAERPDYKCAIDCNARNAIRHQFAPPFDNRCARRSDRAKICLSRGVSANDPPSLFVNTAINKSAPEE
jgi:hypothetical protein